LDEKYKTEKLAMNEERLPHTFASVRNFGFMVTLILILFVSVVSAAVNNNTKVVVFNDGVNFYPLPVQSVDWDDEKIDYVDLLGVHHQCSAVHVLCVYSEHIEKLLESIIASVSKEVLGIGDGKTEYSHNPNFPTEKRNFYRVKIGSEEYTIRYLQNTIAISFSIEENGMYEVGLHGSVKDVPFSAFEARIDGDPVDNIFSGNRFFFLNEKEFGPFIMVTASGMPLKIYLKKGEHTINLVPLVNPDYLFIDGLHLKREE